MDAILDPMAEAGIDEVDFQEELEEEFVKKLEMMLEGKLLKKFAGKGKAEEDSSSGTSDEDAVVPIAKMKVGGSVSDGAPVVVGPAAHHVPVPLVPKGPVTDVAFIKAVLGDKCPYFYFLSVPIPLL